MEDKLLKDFITRSLAEDLGDGDHSSQACIPDNSKGQAKLIVKQNGIIAGIRVAREVFSIIDRNIDFSLFIEDGTTVKPGDIVFHISGNIHSILKSERLVLNIMQRMSGIATSTNEYVARLHGLRTKILDTRKTSPGLRFLEKEAVRIGGALNHRMGLYDMIMLKDNHIDYAGGIENAIKSTNEYIRNNKLNIKVEIEARTFHDIERIISAGGIDRIMLDNFSIENTLAAVKLIDGRFETESSGGISLETIRSYAECGVDFISVGALTHHIKSLDMSLKAF
ncbi:MAG: nicotinate-nucleotide diphosphorylase (carboxylating) [Bacteroidetes bacterium GWE2_41_25]|nr:MAG: nicotinate-nucleotide diphosphorylase (carboxylating) [Bacteroidetes bacterium GWA2_40_15]OFX98344.1 MAG: nicotinate-nucleotide diphosphorylase (carboxylating) [Bacteroidetes bacterium GWE2_41_25]OFY00707.1 MAG: nicotinate-nucleotide diphosphorylase (carboxylating) [Bacteroidetes bacterium GWC2_40_22]OFY59276.1 MAG: nicotinate-nucleotide diphosphorylase (carboxylating) [Bacteroidetes bacterium GWF2_41_9]HAM10413.1 carboxylating nicotinate-nucleotide diphosphorylase [Bacteroidales bacter